jgi:protein-tyrosine-phosphatase
MDVGDAGPLQEMVVAARAQGVDLGEHRARRIEAGELAGADLVIGFEPFHVAAAVVEGGARPEVSFTLAELDSLLDPGGDGGSLGIEGRVADSLRRAHARREGRSRLSAPSIDDPFGARQRVFDHLAVEIEDRVGTLAAALFGAAHAGLGQAGER